MRVRRTIGTFLAAAVVGSGLVVMAEPAAAGRTDTVAALSSWAYIDSVSPFKTFLNGAGDLPVGAWRDAIDKRHISKSYFTFTLPALRGARIFAAELNARETAANDCTKPRSTELWLTDTNERPSWQYQPRERVKLPGPGGSTECTGFVGWDATDVVRTAVAGGQSKITVALRMPNDKQRDPAFGRRYANNPALIITYNFPPNVPTGLAFDNRSCGAAQFHPRGFEPAMSATVTDPDGGAVAARFAFWAVDQPEQRYEVTTASKASGSSFSASAPSSLLADNRMFEWTVRAFDGDDFSDWAPSCRFTTDFTPPAAEPTVSSVDYPNDGAFHGSPGLPGEFTFTANGVPDVAGFRYGSHEFDSMFVAADQLGGSATITFTPEHSFRNELFVRSVDRAGNLSPQRRYSFLVRVTEPFVTSSPANGGNGVPREFAFTPNMDDVVSYRYQLNNGPQGTVAAAGDGTGQVTLMPDRPNNNVLTVRSVTRDGVLSATASYGFNIFDPGPGPGIHSDVYPANDFGGGPGIPGRFDFTPNMPDVVEYVYSLNRGAESVVAAEPDGSAAVTITPTEGGVSMELIVFSRSADGTVSQRRFYNFDVNP